MCNRQDTYSDSHVIMSVILYLFAGRYAAEHTTAAARRHFKEDFGDIAESTVRTFKNLYEQELTRRKSTGESIDITTLPKKKRGRPVMLTSDIDENIQVIA